MEGTTYSWTDAPLGSICEIVGGDGKKFVRWPGRAAKSNDCSWLYLTPMSTPDKTPSWRLHPKNPTQGEVRTLVEGLSEAECAAVCSAPSTAAAIEIAQTITRTRAQAGATGTCKVGDILRLPCIEPGTYAVSMSGDVLAPAALRWPCGKLVAHPPGAAVSADCPPPTDDCLYKVMATGLDQFTCKAIASCASPIARREILQGRRVPVWHARRGVVWSNAYGWGVRFADGTVRMDGSSERVRPDQSRFIGNPLEAFVHVELASLSDEQLTQFCEASDSAELVRLARDSRGPSAFKYWLTDQAAYGLTRYVNDDDSAYARVHAEIYSALESDAAVRILARTLAACGVYIHSTGSGYVGKWSYTTTVASSLLDLLTEYVCYYVDEYDTLCALFDGYTPDQLVLGGRTIVRPDINCGSEIYLSQIVTEQFAGNWLGSVRPAASKALDSGEIYLVSGIEDGWFRGGPWPVHLQRDEDVLCIWNFGDRERDRIRLEAAAQSLARDYRALRRWGYLSTCHLTASA